MAFESKGNVRYNKLAKREAKVQELRNEGTPESRKQLKAMLDWHPEWENAGHRRAVTPNGGMMHNPKGKRHVKASSAKCDRINRGHRAKLNQGKGI